MSSRTLLDPYQQPFTVLARYRNVNAAFRLSITSMRGTPTRIASPPLRVMLIVCSIVGPRPITSKATSAPRPFGVRPDDVGDRVALVGLHEVGGAELLGHLELRLEHVDGDDLLGAGDLGALDHVEADAAAADDRDRVALADVGGVEGGTDAGEHAAADERGDSGGRRRRRSSPARSRGRWRSCRTCRTSPSGAAAGRRG